MKKIALIILTILINTTLWSQQNIKQDKEAIKKMCGCYEVKFNYAEVYSPDLAYELKKPYTSQATEWVSLVSEEDDKISMQHILQISPKRIIKHWRQDWEFEAQAMYAYDYASRWERNKISSKEAKGTWTQKVFQVDDSPRYEGYGKWIHQADKSYWEAVADSPLPRRDLTTRDDYNILERRNRHVIMGDLRLHEQDNKKISRSQKYGDELIVVEKGYNTYKKIDDDKCKYARAWWESNQNFWKIVRNEWADLTANSAEIKLDFEDGKNATFYQAMSGLGKKYIAAGDFDTVAAQKEINELIVSYLMSAKK